MGSRMATNLLKNNHAITVWNRGAEPRKALAEAGAVSPDTLAEAVADADIIFSMLSNPEAVRELFLEDGGGLDQMKKDALWVDSSTVNPSFSREAHKVAESKGIRFIDAPVAGTKPHAENAQLSFFVGGTAENIEPIKPYLDAMGAKSIPFGKVGQGSAFKMLVNIMLAQSMLVFSEAVLLGEALNIDREFLLNVIPGLPVIAPFTKMKVDMIRSGEYDTQFPLELVHKDIHLAAVSAYEAGRPLFLANLSKDIYAQALKAGMGRQDFAAVHEFLK